MFEHGDDSAEEVAAITRAGVYVMGRHMFTADRGEWDLSWTGWWGPEPPYHAPVFVLCGQPRDPVELAGGTTFHFVTRGLPEAMARAKEAAGNRDVSIAGGVTTLDEVRLAPVSARTTPHVTPLTWRRPA